MNRRLKQQARTIYNTSLEADTRSRASQYRQKAILAAPEADRFILRTYVQQIGAQRRNTSGWNLS